MKRGTRVGILVEGSTFFLCVFRGFFLEAFFIGVSKADVLSKLEESGVTKEISYSNFGLGREYSGELIERCVRIAEGLKEKLKNY